MKKSRFIETAILLSAMMVMLMNSVKPHHHHRHEVCFNSYHCHDEDSNDGGGHHAHDGYDHSHGHPFDDQCKVNSFFIPPGTQKISKAPPSSSQKNLSLSIAIEKDAPDLSPPPLTCRKFIVLTETGQSLKSLVRALRAPPSC